MLVLLILALTIQLQAQAMPTSFGPPTEPTIIHDAITTFGTILLGRQIHCDCAGPMERTLVDIIRSCLLTIAACVYRAIHQNIPDPKASWGQRQWLRIKITLLALFAPEMMIWWAMKQWMAARVFRDRVNEMNLGLNWTVAHGHFVQMGGFIRKDNEYVLPPGTLLEFLPKLNQVNLIELRKVTEREIQDHSKGDILSKGLVTLQTTWFIVECIARWQQKLIITELEVVTLAFSVLNLLTYAFWWHKPLDVLCPIRITVLNQENPTSPPDTTPSDTDPHIGSDATETSRLVGDAPVGIIAVQHPSALSNAWESVKEWIAEGVENIKSDYRHMGFWRALIEVIVIRPFETISNRLERLFEDTDVDSTDTHVPTFYSMKLPRRKWNFVLHLSCFIGAVFGSIHSLSWNAHFSSPTASVLWRASTIVLVVEPLLVACVQVYVDTFSDSILDSTLRRLLIPLLAILMVGLPSTVGPIAYLLARICLLVLASLTLTSLPPQALQTISWTSYIPHL